VDVQAEGRIAESVARLSGTTTVLIVSHRRGMLTRCDQIFDLESGKILRPASRGDLLESA
jgi:ABC-type multidrug transport system fused ATPase/permease subunit